MPAEEPSPSSVLADFALALVNFAVAALRMYWRGWAGLGALLRHPLESKELIAGLAAHFREAAGVLREMHLRGLVVMTPVEAPLLRTALTGLGDLATSVASYGTITPDLVASHFSTLRAKLEPVQQASESVMRLHSLFFALWTTVEAVAGVSRAPSESLASFESNVLPALAWWLAVPLIWTFFVQFGLRIASRWALARLTK